MVGLTVSPHFHRRFLITFPWSSPRLSFPFLLVTRCFTSGTIKTNKMTNKTEQHAIRTVGHCIWLQRKYNYILSKFFVTTDILYCMWTMTTVSAIIVHRQGVSGTGQVFFQFIFCGSWAAEDCGIDRETRQARDNVKKWSHFVGLCCAWMNCPN